MERPILVNLVFLLAVSGLTSAETYVVPPNYPGIQVAIDSSNDQWLPPADLSGPVNVLFGTRSKLLLG